ncbi:unnamed protein product [Rhizophagus irregularis]|nr:unnamed protein product [Rhizophagus irregularis]
MVEIRLYGGTEPKLAFSYYLRCEKENDSTYNRNQESACIDCGFLVNAVYHKRPNLVFINKFISEYNHALHNVSALQKFSPILRKIPNNIMKEIQFYVQEYHLDLYRAICKFKSNFQVKNDAATLIEYLKMLHEEDFEWYFQVDFEGIDNRLSKVFWMSPK